MSNSRYRGWRAPRGTWAAPAREREGLFPPYLRSRSERRRDADGHRVSSGTHFISLRSYLKPLALLRASLFEFMTRYHLLLFLLVIWTALKGTTTSFSPIPRNPQTPMMRAVALPSRSTSTSMISPILLSLGS